MILPSDLIWPLVQRRRANWICLDLHFDYFNQKSRLPLPSPFHVLMANF